MTNIPPKYSSTLPRVSSIVEYFFPFTGEAKVRFHDWLYKNNIKVDEYMKEASEGGTFVHKKLEEFIGGKKYTGKKYKGFIDGGIQFLKDYNVKPLHIEEYIRTKDYQGTIDLIGEINGQKWILDWKNYGLAKHKFNLPIPEYKKPYDKLKKARLQLSLYAKAKRIKKIGIIELTEEGYHFHELEPYSNKELNEMVKEFKFYYVDEI